MKVKGLGWFAMAGVGAEMASIGRRMEKQQKLVQSGIKQNNYQQEAQPKEKIRYNYTVNDIAIMSLGDTISSLLELLVFNGVDIPIEVMYEARNNIEFMQWLLNRGGINDYAFGIKQNNEEGKSWN